jgi:hypothetical protein
VLTSTLPLLDRYPIGRVAAPVAERRIVPAEGEGADVEQAFPVEAQFLGDGAGNLGDADAQVDLGPGGHPHPVDELLVLAEVVADQIGRGRGGCRVGSRSGQDDAAGGRVQVSLNVGELCGQPALQVGQGVGNLDRVRHHRLAVGAEREDGGPSRRLAEDEEGCAGGRGLNVGDLGVGDEDGGCGAGQRDGLAGVYFERDFCIGAGGAGHDDQRQAKEDRAAHPAGNGLEHDLCFLERWGH